MKRKQRTSVSRPPLQGGLWFAPGTIAALSAPAQANQNGSPTTIQAPAPPTSTTPTTGARVEIAGTGEPRIEHAAA